MKKIVLKTIKKELNQYDVDETAKQLVLINIELFNDLIDDYNKDEIQHNAYLMYQLSLQIFKMLSSLKKNKNIDGAGDEFTKMIEEIKKKAVSN
jgi:hypothetical protein